MKLKQYIYIGYGLTVLLMVGSVIWASKQMLIMETEGPFIITMAVVASIIGTFVTTVFLRSVFHSLNRLKEGMVAIASQRFTPIHLEKAPVEFVEVAETLNEMNVQLEQAFEEIKESEVEKRMMISQLTHDIKTPITSIQQTIEAIVDGVIQPKERTMYLQTIHRQTMRLNQLVEELQDITVAQEQTIPSKIEEVLLDKLLLQVLSEFQWQIEKEERTVEVHVTPQNAKCTTVPDKLYRILYNLVSNALKYSPEKTTLTISAMVTDEGLKITVADEGIGIPESEQEAIFKRFHRVEQSRNLQTGGHGLGLAIAKELAEQLGGTLNVNSEEGKGAVFLLSAPTHVTVDGLTN